MATESGVARRQAVERRLAQGSAPRVAVGSALPDVRHVIGPSGDAAREAAGGRGSALPNVRHITGPLGRVSRAAAGALVYALGQLANRPR